MGRIFSRKDAKKARYSLRLCVFARDIFTRFSPFLRKACVAAWLNAAFGQKTLPRQRAGGNI
ncbi:MAG TPA: hypothetical protein VFO99_18060, partial [Pyrinomonadaceae bacterium]|nr:hypothetical protein [Pyrinomonadaceae bacterium]